MNPYTTLGVPPTATDREVRHAYLAAVRENPPDTAPERFQAISKSYEKIKTEDARLRHLLFDKEMPGDSPVDAVLKHLRETGPPAPLAAGPMRAFLRAQLTGTPK